MATDKQKLGELGEIYVTKISSCPQCKRKKTLKRLPPNFKCADLICDFCGYLAQVKTMTSKNVESIPKTVIGAAWKPQKDRMKSGIYFPLFLVLVNKEKQSEKAVYYLSADLQTQNMFKPRKPISKKDRRAGWQGFHYDTRNIKESFIRIT